MEMPFVLVFPDQQNEGGGVCFRCLGRVSG